MRCKNSRPWAFATFLNDCNRIEIVGYTNILDSWILCDYLCVLRSLDAGFHGSTLASFHSYFKTKFSRHIRPTKT